MTFVFKLSKEGYDAKETTEANQSFNAATASHSVFNVVNATLTSSSTSQTVTHGLDFVPKVWIFMAGSDGDGDFLRSIPYLDETDFKVDYKIDDTEIIIEGDGAHTSDLDFKIVIFTRSPSV